MTTQVLPSSWCSSLSPTLHPTRRPTRVRSTAANQTNSKELYLDHERQADATLLSLLRERRTEEAWEVYDRSSTDLLPSSTCLSRLVAQLSYQNTPSGLTRAQSILARLRDHNELHRLDANSLGLLASAAAKFNHLPYATSIVYSMLRSGYLPHVKAWSAVLARLASSPEDGPSRALKLFRAVLHRIRRLPDGSVAAESRPDTGAFNSALNACANLGDKETFLKLFDEMPEFGVEPDILSYNILIKLCARCNRRDLIVFVLERIVEKGLPLCMTTFQSLVAAYVGFGELETAEMVVQALREGRRDICKILREANVENATHDEDAWSGLENEGVDDGEVFKKLLPNWVEDGGGEPPLLPKVFVPNSRMYTTLMKGYMNQGRVADTVRMLEAMQHQEDRLSHPDHVSYTTVISALAKSGAMDQARQVLAEMARIGVPANRVTYNILLKGYCQQEQLGAAKDLFEQMTEEAKIEPDVISYNTLIDGCVQIDDSAGAIAYFNEMREKGIAPTKISYTTLMKAFVMSGQPKLANSVFDEMYKDPLVKVDLIAWNMLVEGFCRSGLVEEAKNVIKRMKEDGFYPNVATYSSLANGISVARKPGEALLLWKEVKERCTMSNQRDESGTNSVRPPPFKPDDGLLDALADLCVRAAFFQKALEIVACMEEYGIPPNKTKYKKIYVEMHSRMFTSKHASQARQDRRKQRKRAAEAFKFWLGLPNSYYESDWFTDRDDRASY